MMMTMKDMADIKILSDEEQDFVDSEEDHARANFLYHWRKYLWQ